MASERDKLVEDKAILEEELVVMKSQIHEFQVCSIINGTMFKRDCAVKNIV